MNIKNLEQELADRLKAVELQKQKDAAEFEQKRRAREKEIALAKAAQQKALDQKIALRVAAEKKQRDEVAAWEKAERERRFAEDQANLKLQEEREAEEAKALALQEQLARLEHAEEMRRKALEEMLPPVLEPEEILSGPNGLTPTTSEMSEHLKILLRQDRDFTNE